MQKVEIFTSHQQLEDIQRVDDMRMSPEERLEAGFKLIELAISFSPDKKLPNAVPDHLPWIELKWKYGFPS